jgi:hypothetical protein
LEVESRKDIVSEYVPNNERQEVVLDEDTLKMTNGSRLLLAEDADKKGDKSQITAFLCFYLRGLNTKGSSGSFSTCPTVQYLHFSALDFQPRCLLQGESCHMIKI